jgi:FkbM family methyltransferase
MKRIVIAAAVVLAAGGFVAMNARARLSAWVLLGRSPVCPYANAIESANNWKRQIELKDEILKASKLIEKDKDFELFDTPDGRYWMPVGSQYVLPFNLAEQARDIYDVRSATHGIRGGDIVLDCGANVGVFTRKALNAGAKTVVAIEPAPENIECLRRNFKPEIEAGRVIVYPKGVWDKDDMLTLNVDPHNSAADSFLIHRQGAVSVMKVPLTTIDRLVAELKLERVDFIKMDIEGAEPNAIRGGRATIARDKPRMALSAYHAPDHPVVVPQEARAAYSGYKMECGPCAEANYGVRPDILYFYP